LKAKIIKALLIEGTSIKKIGQIMKMKRKDVNNIIFEVWETEKIVEDNKIYSSSEDYLLNGDKTTYKDLSPSEKKIYNNLN
jgi:DNA-binding transcriptional MerR regulator